MSARLWHAVDVATAVAALLVSSAAVGRTRETNESSRIARIRAARMPRVEQVIAFDTLQADAVLAAWEVFPPDNPWNQVVAEWPVHPRSRSIVETIGADKPFRMNFDMGFAIVPPDQPRVALKVVDYSSESDRGPFPNPDSLPIEGWPRGYVSRSALPDDVQRNMLNEQGDRHAIVADNGIAWAISVAPDPRIPDMHDELRRIKGSDFEVVQPPADYRPPVAR